MKVTSEPCWSCGSPMFGAWSSQVLQIPRQGENGETLYWCQDCEVGGSKIPWKERTAAGLAEFGSGF